MYDFLVLNAILNLSEEVRGGVKRGGVDWRVDADKEQRFDDL